MTDAFSEARRIFEIQPGVGSLEQGLRSLARAGVEHPLIRSWARSISAEYGVDFYVRPVLERLRKSTFFDRVMCEEER